MVSRLRRHLRWTPCRPLRSRTDSVVAEQRLANGALEAIRPPPTGPFSGLTVTDPDGRTVFVDEAGYDIDITTYLRDPGEIEPLLSKPQMLAGIRSPIRYFFDAYRLRVPSLGLDVSSIPMVPAPAHTMPVDYFNGPTQLQGTMAGQPVRGYGFHERTLPLSRPRELLVVLRDSLLHLPPGDVDPPSSPQHLADLAWQAKPLIDEDKPLPAASFLNSRFARHCGGRA